MAPARRLMAVLAHPDDETLGVGGLFVRYAREGVETHLVTATRGQRGRFGTGETHPGPEALGRIREAELRAAAAALEIGEVRVLDYMDGALDQVDPRVAIEAIASELRRVRPQVVLTFDSFGAYGHPDHVAISQLATAAVMAAAGSGVPVAKLYYLAWPSGRWAAYQSVFKTLSSTVDGVTRVATPWPDWAITTRLDTRAYWREVWSAVQCHASQIAMYGRLAGLTPEAHEALWGAVECYRAMSLVNGGRTPETCLFEGLP